MLPLTPQLLLGFILASIIGFLGWRVGALDRSGALGAFLIGGAVFGFGGPVWGAVLVVFFLSSSLLSFVTVHRLPPPSNLPPTSGGGFSDEVPSPLPSVNGGIEGGKRLLSFFRSDRKTDTGAARAPRRNLSQTLANGGLAAVLAIVVGIVTRESPWYPTLTLAYFGALSAAAADTWATELGLLSSRPPRLLTTRVIVPAGRSGGVTSLGLLASLAGGAFIGTSAFILIQLASLLTTGQWFLQDWFLLPLCTLAGISGSLVDSLLGATWQRQNFCNECQTITEQTVHSCGARSQHQSGISWLNNEVVNLLATITGALTTAILSLPFI